MAKDLPYFKFIISEWNDGDVTLCSLEAQGLFINLCSLYWSQEGDLSLSKSKRRFSGCNATAWDELINDHVIKIDGDNIVINFLDEQFEERGKLSTTNAQNASKGWEKRKKDATALRPHSNGIKVASNIEEKRREEKKKEENRKEEISLADFEGLFDEIWKEQVQIVHQGKDIQKAIGEAYLHLGAGGRLLNGMTADFKKCVQSFLSNQRTNAPSNKPKAFEL